MTTRPDKPDTSCPACDSPDTIPYPYVEDGSTMAAVLKTHYPTARKCVDCECVWW